MTKNIDINEVRALARRGGSSLLEQATDEQLDSITAQNADRPAATPGWLAALVGVTAEFNVLCDRLRGAVADGGILGIDPATDREMRAFRRVQQPQTDHPVFARAQAAIGSQIFLARRLFTLAGDIVNDAGADIDASGRVLAVSCVLCRLAAWQAAIPKSVADALPADEWGELRASREFAMSAVRH